MILVSADLLPSNVTIDAVYDTRQIFVFTLKKNCEMFLL